MTRSSRAIAIAWSVAAVALAIGFALKCARAEPTPQPTSVATPIAGSWAQLRALAVDLADRPVNVVVSPGALGGSLPTPVMRGTGGAATLVVPTIFEGADVEAGNGALFEFLRAHAGGSATRPELAAQFVALLRAGEAELHARGLPVDSLGSAIEYALENAYGILGRAERLDDGDEAALHGLIALEIAMQQRSADAEVTGDAARERLYQRTLVQTQLLRVGFAAASGTGADGFRAQAAKFLDALKIGNDVRLARLVCALPGTSSCDATFADARPILARIAARYPY